MRLSYTTIILLLIATDLDSIYIVDTTSLFFPKSIYIPKSIIIQNNIENNVFPKLSKINQEWHEYMHILNNDDNVSRLLK